MERIHPSAIVAKGAELGEDVEIGPYCIVGDHAKLGSRTRLLSNVNIEGFTEIGADCVIHPFASLGGPPQDTAYAGEPTRLVIGDRNLIREHVTMNTGTARGRGVTRVGSDGFFMIASHVGHDCIVGDHVTMANCATLGGYAQIADYVIMGGLAAAHQHSRIGRHTIIGGLACVTRDVIPFASAWGNHCHLEGLNLIGLKRRGFSREVINDLRAAFRLLFAEEGTLQERITDVERVFADSSEVGEIIDFIQADAVRPLCLPHVDD